MTRTADFYDELAPFYHLIHQDWDAGVRRQGEQLCGLIESEWPGCTSVLDVSCGIGTQSIALAERGYSVTASDLSAGEIERARHEARTRKIDIDFSVGDMRQAHALHGSRFDLVISCDNSVPHLLTDDDLLLAFQQMLACLRAGGGCIISVRDYALEARGKNLVKPYGVRTENGKRYLLFQVWDFVGEHYDLSFFFIEEDLSTLEVKTHAMRSKYYAVSIDRLCELMREAGFRDIKRVDGAFYQPLVIGTKAAEQSRLPNRSED